MVDGKLLGEMTEWKVSNPRAEIWEMDYRGYELMLGRFYFSTNVMVHFMELEFWKHEILAMK